MSTTNDNQTTDNDLGSLKGAELLKAARAAKGYSCRDLIRFADVLWPSNISSMEQGKISITAASAAKLGPALGVDPDRLVAKATRPYWKAKKPRTTELKSLAEALARCVKNASEGDGVIDSTLVILAEGVLDITGGAS